MSLFGRVFRRGERQNAQTNSQPERAEEAYGLFTLTDEQSAKDNNIESAFFESAVKHF